MSNPRVKRHAWEIIIACRDGDGVPPGVRRFNVPGGWLYQVEHYELLAGTQKLVRIWHPPVFVPEVKS